MKRFFICAAAAIVALAACSKTEVINNSVPQEIGFKAVAGATTKAEQTTASFTQDMGVFAYLTGTTTPYFGHDQFIEDGEVYSSDQYWPISGALDFVVYSPYVEGTTYESKVLTITANNSSNTVIANQIDYLYGQELITNKAKGASPVTATFKHAQAKITLSFKGENVTVKNVKLVTPTLKGTCKVTYESPVAVAWSELTPSADVEMIETAALSATATTASLLVVPTTASDITFTYNFGTGYPDQTYTIDLTETWEYNTHYTYNVSITPQEITFKPVVAEWDAPTTPPANTEI